MHLKLCSAARPSLSCPSTNSDALQKLFGPFRVLEHKLTIKGHNGHEQNLEPVLFKRVRFHTEKNKWDFNLKHETNWKKTDDLRSLKYFLKYLNIRFELFSSWRFVFIDTI